MHLPVWPDTIATQTLHYHAKVRTSAVLWRCLATEFIRFHMVDVHCVQCIRMPTVIALRWPNEPVITSALMLPYR